MSLPPAVDACRRGVRRCVADIDPGRTVVVACSGGADSLALAAATVHEARRPGLRVVGVTVDHGLQDGSTEHAERVRGQLLALGCAEARVVRVEVVAAGDGPEAAARRARYDALHRIAGELAAACVLLGHTRDDQAETVLLGLARGSGARSLAGMPASAGPVRRPLLDVTRADTEAACAAAGLTPWQDPHNDDPGYARVRVRRRLLPLLEDQLGPGVTDALARTAGLLRADTEALDELARVAYAGMVSTGSTDESNSTDEVRSTDEGSSTDGGPVGRACRDQVWVPVAELVEHPRAIATRVLRLAALEAGAIDAELFHVHVQALWQLATGEISGEVQLPGHVSALRDAGAIRFVPGDVPS